MSYTAVFIFVGIFVFIQGRHSILTVSGFFIFEVCLVAGFIRAYFHNTTLLWIQFLTYLLAILAFGSIIIISLCKSFLDKLTDPDDLALTNSLLLIIIMIYFVYFNGASLFFALRAWLITISFSSSP